MWFLTRFAQQDCSPRDFLGIPSWDTYLYNAGYIDYNSNSNACEFSAQLVTDSAINFVPISLIGLGILDILLRVAALVAVGFVIYGGMQYVFSSGEPDKAKGALGTIKNALIGLGITVFAATLVAFIGGSEFVVDETAQGLPVTQADLIERIINWVFALTAVVGVLIIVVSGIKFMTSRGDPGETAKARNTILYVAIGLVVMALAYGIVSITLNVLGGD